MGEAHNSTLNQQLERINSSPQAEVKGRDKAGKRTPDVPRHPTRQRLLPHASPSAQPVNHLAWRWRQTAKGRVSTQHCCKGQKPPPGLAPGQWLNFTKDLLRFLEGCTDNTPTWQKTVISQHFETKLALLGLSRKGGWRQGSLEGLVPHRVTAVPVRGCCCPQPGTWTPCGCLPGCQQGGSHGLVTNVHGIPQPFAQMRGSPSQGN